MKLDMNLKPNDIILLKILACVLIGFLSIRFVIFPAIEKHQDLVDEKEQALIQQEDMQYAIDTIPTTEKKIENQKASLTEASSDFYASMENREVDELVTGLALVHQLFPVSLNISEATADIPAVYQNVAQTQSASSTETVSAEDELNGTATSSDAASGNSGEASQIDYIYTTNVSLTIEGSEDGIIEFLDDIAKNYPGIQVRSFEMEEKNYVGSSLENVTLMRCKCELAVYTYADINDSSDQNTEAGGEN